MWDSEGYIKIGNRKLYKPSKFQIGITKVFQKRSNKAENVKTGNMMRTIMFNGSYDKIHKSKYFGVTKWITKEHPTERGYFKKFIVLNTRGKEKLLHYRKMKLKWGHL